MHWDAAPRAINPSSVSNRSAIRRTPPTLIPREREFILPLIRIAHHPQTTHWCKEIHARISACHQYKNTLTERRTKSCARGCCVWTAQRAHEDPLSHMSTKHTYSAINTTCCHTHTHTYILVYTTSLFALNYLRYRHHPLGLLPPHLPNCQQRR